MANLSQNNDTSRFRRIKSFVLRQSRLTSGQQKAFQQHWKDYGLEFSSTPFAFSEIFGNENPVIVEIGFGNGDSLAQMASRNPSVNYLGIEVHRPGVGHLLIKIEELQIGNLRIISHDAIEILQQMIPANSIDGVQLFFPDPWHKKRHHKRRIVQKIFLDYLARILKHGGFFHTATDWDDYALHINSVIDSHPDFQREEDDNANKRISQRPETKFEQRGIKLGHNVNDIIAIKKAP